MHVTNSPEVTVTAMVIVVVGAIGFMRFLRWVNTAPLHPDPWDEELERAVKQDDAVPVCHHCFSPAPPGQWFCESCGTAVGPYNNWMPYLYVFSQGEVLRNGVTDRVRRSPLTLMGYFLISLNCFLVFAPVFWFLLLRHWRTDSPGRVQATERPTQN